MENKNTFRIGELSRLFGIGVDSIRYYEKVGLLHPVRDPNNNYRLYTMDDVRRMTLIRELLNLNFSTEQVREFCTDLNLDNTLRLLNSEMETVEKQISELENTRRNIQNRLTTIQRLSKMDLDEQVYLKTLPERACIMVSDSNLPDSDVDYYVMNYMNLHQNKIDTIGTCDCYTLDLEGSNPDSLYYRTKNVFFYASSLPVDDCNYFLPAGKYLSTIYRGPYSKTKKLMPGMFAYAKEHQLVITGDPIEFCHIDNYETSNEEEYVIEIQIPVSDVAS